MPFTYDTVTIDSVDYDVYEAVAAADTILAADFKRAATWAALTTDQKGQALYSSTWWHEGLRLQGEKTEDDNTYQMPRTGLTDKEGNAVDSATLPAVWLRSVVIRAHDISQDADQQGATSFGDNVKRVKAGSVEVEKFRPVAGLVIPKENLDLIGSFLAGSSRTLPTFGGTTVEADISDADEYDLCEGYS